MIKTLFVAGPTAAGKTEFAIRLAEALGGDIVSADSMQIYKYMDIGSAKPTAEERARARHYLVDEIDPAEPFNVSDYQALALKYIEKIDSEGRLPIVCGGTGLYIDALACGLDFSAAKGSPEDRQRIIDEAGGDPARLHAMLAELSPKAAEQIHPNNMLRVARYIERIRLGETDFAAYTDLQRKSGVLDPVMICVTRERQELYSRIDRRVDKLYETGLADEVKGLMERGFTDADIAMKGIGYKEIIAALRSGRNADSARDEIKLNTRHLAKRQISWIKRYPDMKWFEVAEGREYEAFEEMLAYAKERLNG
jgi:tRNA dimethylallyltransferase